MFMSPFVTRSVLALLVAAAVFPASAASAAAAAPVREPIVIPSPGSFAGLCSFEVDYTVVTNTSYSLVWFDAAGNPTKAITQGHLVVSFTNATNPAHTATLNISGPGQTSFNADGSETIVSDGNWIIFTDADIIYSTGRLVLVAPDPLSPGVITSATGQQRSLCSMLS